ncbi:MAG: hypothetical protein KDD78_06465 [Caldilineaceae bacterium]|nr:hypothetical protein [Caldilineaceae bacterium]
MDSLLPAGWISILTPIGHRLNRLIPRLIVTPDINAHHDQWRVRQIATRRIVAWLRHSAKIKNAATVKLLQPFAASSVMIGDCSNTRQGNVIWQPLPISLRRNDDGTHDRRYFDRSNRRKACPTGWA